MVQGLFSLFVAAKLVLSIQRTVIMKEKLSDARAIDVARGLMVLTSLLNTFMTSRLVKNHLTNFALPKRLRPITDNRYPNLITTCPLPSTQRAFSWKNVPNGTSLILSSPFLLLFLLRDQCSHPITGHQSLSSVKVSRFYSFQLI